ncbi:hypothetical protein TWF694_003609 [Orbilia ellipsospora]|uniref:Uncharacterized protein n=1 Tax=Orbilia ellipsospora TaxID=2528407 RepID=A0AAV9X4N6_9PEZI
MLDSEPTTSDGRSFVPALITPKHSVPVPAEFLEGYFSKLEVRVHHRNKDEERECNNVTQEWVNRGGRGQRPTVITPAGCILSLTFPEADPQKLVDITALTCFGFIEDDYADGDMFRSKDIWKPGTPLEEQENIRKDLGIILKQIRHKLFLEILEKDNAQNNYLQSYDAWVKTGVEYNGELQFDDPDTYLSDRMDNLGASVYHNLLPLIHDVNLTKEDYNRLRCLDETMYQMCAIANDMGSVECDWANHITFDKPGLPPNYVFVTMDVYDVTLGEAREVAIKKWKELEDKFLMLREQVMSECPLSSSDEYAKYISYQHYVAAGTVVWTMQNPRYRLREGETPFFPKPEHKIADLPRKTRVTNGVVGKTANGDTKTQNTKSKGTKRALDYNGAEREFNPINSKRVRLDENIDGDSDKPKVTSPWLRNYPEQIPDKITLEPFEYVKSLPSKGVRDAALDALDVWYRVPQKSVDKIKSIIDKLHSSSLIIDDIEDNSPLRRGQPSAHMVFGTPQSINSANYLFVKCLDEVQSLGGSAVAIFTEELGSLHVGQGLDLHWTFHEKCPTESEYIQMIDGKTGGLFRMASRLMRNQATRNKTTKVENLMTLLGRFFQIRDDYQNLKSTDYAKQKGTLSDLDEGKYSFILLHALSSPSPNTTKLHSLLKLRSRNPTQTLTDEQKELVMRCITRAGSMDYTYNVLEELQDKITEELETIERSIKDGEENWIIRAIMARLRLADPNIRSMMK